MYVYSSLVQQYQLIFDNKIFLIKMGLYQIMATNLKDIRQFDSTYYLSNVDFSNSTFQLSFNPVYFEQWYSFLNVF